LIGPDAIAARLDLGIPQNSWQSSKGRTPARGSRQVITGRIQIAAERPTKRARKIIAGGVTQEINAGQAGAVIKPKAPDAGDAVAYRNAGQAGAAKERPNPNSGDGVGNRVASNHPGRTFDEGGLVLVEQHPIQTAVGGIVCIHQYRCQAGAEFERRVSDAGHVGAYRDAGQSSIVVKRRISDSCDSRTIYCAGDGHITTRTAISRDGDCVVCGRVIPDAIIVCIRLSFHHTRQRPQQQDRQQPQGASRPQEPVHCRPRLPDKGLMSRVHSGSQHTTQSNGVKDQCLRALGMASGETSREFKGKRITASNAAFYALEHCRSGRRSVGNSCCDVYGSATRLHGRTKLSSLDDVTGTDELGEPLLLHDVLSSNGQESPCTKAARHLDWSEFLSGLSTRDVAIIECLAQGKPLAGLARKRHLNTSTIMYHKERLAQRIANFMGADILVEVRRKPRWMDSINAAREKIAYREQHRTL